ncbi:MAG: hypothetical protein PUC78_04935 [Baileyella intestinalis]|uniref:hypothetical protein n=1 Tax=Baileyella intestinalis TaxID=2606709 RepID=UPI0023F0A988|nr:hypothetical protein [Baileyella intestinalis]MDD5875205.1 hypothetical protein [Baileyella intestinalis]
MSIAGIEKVRQAEAEAAELRKSAEDEAAAIADSAKKESRAILDEAERQADESYKATLAQAEAEGERLYEDRISKEKEACLKFSEAASSRLEEAADLIVGKVVGTYGNS